MRCSGAVFVVAFAAGGFVSSLVGAGTSPEAEGSAVIAPHVTRVFYLQAMHPREAITLLRSEVQIVQIATVGDRSIIVVSDVAEKVTRSETLLRQRDAVLRIADPHGPLDLQRMAQTPTETRVFRIAGDDMNAAVTLLRAIYQVRHLNRSPETNSVSVEAARAVLDSSEALLRELNLLLEPS